MNDEMIDEVEKALKHYATILNAEGEKFELFGVKSNPDLFEKAGKIWGLAERVIECKKKTFANLIPFKR